MPTTLPSPPSSPTSVTGWSRRHYHRDRRRRIDCYDILQTIIRENERLEREEYEAMLKEAPAIIINFNKLKDQPPSILIKPDTPPQSPTSSTSLKRSANVRFATGPPKVFS
ncbi:hypothetical protein EC973_009457 [Apophysomyces ossiformis]|uniref:Uncharacterized protein n=1 Tax=Apophysomyces ossiformis TaxID=679940 RepID=A0A8H7BS00_9FUNG|nr:hypothetical protein EC973_009457 [Apophysomyces ossiformis]